MAVRVFLGTQPQLNVERKLLRQVQGVFAWYNSKKRIKEQANEFLELDATSNDVDTMLRYAHVHFVRKFIVQEVTEKQLALLEAGKPPKAADHSTLSCINECLFAGAKNVEAELSILANVKQTASALPGRRELDPSAPLERSDILAMMRCFEEDNSAVADFESRSRAFLPASVVASQAHNLIAFLCPDAKKDLEKKDAKLLAKMVSGDYNKIGCVDKLRPIDVTATYRFLGERLCGAAPGETFKRYLWANVLRKYATHPGYLASISSYWTVSAGLDASPPLLQLPLSTAEAACAAQKHFPALKFRALSMYTSPDTARQQWRGDDFIPFGQLFPLLGSAAADELLASTLVEGYWERLGLKPADNIKEDRIARGIQAFVDEMSTLYNSNLELLLQRVGDAHKVVIPPVKVDEKASN